jgi:hypothetical protein
MSPSADLTIYGSENCPVCLEEWTADDVIKKTAKCGHSCCLTCMQSVVASTKPLCPVCRADYTKNETFKMVENPLIMNDWYKKTLVTFDDGVLMNYLWDNPKHRMRWVKRFINFPLFKKSVIEKYGFEMFVGKWKCLLVNEMEVLSFRPPDVGGVGVYIIKQNH